MTITNILVIIAAPIVAVFVGQWLQDRSQTRKDKLDVFKILMMNRFVWSYESARALNIIDIVFAKDKDVLAQWSEYYKLLCIQKPDEMQFKQRLEAQDKLLEAMAKVLGYKDQITWDRIQNPYIPQGMVVDMEQQQMIQSGQVEWAKIAGRVSQMMSANPTFQQPEQQEENDHANTGMDREG